MPLSNCILALQLRLDQIQPYGYQAQPVGMTLALMSPENKSEAVRAKFLSDDGKFKKYQITYIPADCTAPTDCSGGIPTGCGEGTSQSITTDTLTIDHCLHSGIIELDEDQFRDLCNFTPSDFTMAQIMGKMDTFRRAINAALVTEVCGFVGAFNDAEAGPKDLRLINTTTGAINILAETDVLADFTDAGMNTNPIIVGGRSMLAYNRAIKGAGMTQDGIDVSAGETLNAKYDNQIQGICGIADKETAIAFAPKVLQLVNFLRYVGDFQANAKIDQDNVLSFLKQGDTYHKGVIRDNVTGMYYDFKAVYDPCLEKWRLSFFTNFDIWPMPLTQCFSDDFTGVLKYGICPYSTACPA